jgi:hypothetical protein
MSTDDQQVTTQQEDVISRYKKLLTMARSNLEANQKLLGEKDQQIADLSLKLEELSKHLQSKNRIEDDSSQFPRRIICRVDVEGVIWILLEFEAIDDDWKCFSDELALQDYIKCIPGPPLMLPQRCLSVEESSRIVRKTSQIR